MCKIFFICFFSVLATTPSLLYAKDVNISDKISYVNIEYKNDIIRIERNQNTNNILEGIFAKTSRVCPPYCIQPMQVAPGVKTIGELEVLDFISNDVKLHRGLLIDARTNSWYKKGTIPGSIHIPFTIFGLDKNDELLLDAMAKLGVKRELSANADKGFWSWTFFDDEKKNKIWDFSNAKNLILWCNGIWCEQSPKAIKSLLKQGYPASKIKYYRGGMQSWLILGLTVVKP